MIRHFDPAPAAAVLAEAWRTGTLLAELPAAIRPVTMIEGYDVQDLFVADLGESVRGWKLGMGSEIQKRQSGLGRSIAGRILGSRLYSPGDTVILPNAAAVTIEFEMAYVLGRDILPDEADRSVLDAVSEVRAAFELVLSRFIDRRAVGWPSFAADNGAFEALVLGDTIELRRIGELSSTLVVSCDGEEASRSLCGEDVTDPAGALADLVALARERMMVLPTGSIISTGTVSQPFSITAGLTKIDATFAGAELSFRMLRIAEKSK